MRERMYMPQKRNPHDLHRADSSDISIRDLSINEIVKINFPVVLFLFLLFACRFGVLALASLCVSLIRVFFEINIEFQAVFCRLNGIFSRFGARNIVAGVA